MKRDMKWNLQFIMKTEKKAFLIDARQTEVKCFFLIVARTGQLPIFVLKASEISICREVCLDVFFLSSFVSLFVGSSQSPPRSTLMKRSKMAAESLSEFCER